MAKLEDQANKHEYCLLRTQVQPNAGWGDLCERCEHSTLRINRDRVRSDFPCEKWGTDIALCQPYPNLSRYSNTGADVKINDVRGVDFVEICSAFVREDDPL